MLRNHLTFFSFYLTLSSSFRSHYPLISEILQTLSGSDRWSHHLANSSVASVFSTVLLDLTSYLPFLLNSSLDLLITRRLLHSLHLPLPNDPRVSHVDEISAMGLKYISYLLVWIHLCLFYYSLRILRPLLLLLVLNRVAHRNGHAFTFTSLIRSHHPWSRL